MCIDHTTFIPRFGPPRSPGDTAEGRVDPRHDHNGTATDADQLGWCQGASIDRHLWQFHGVYGDDQIHVGHNEIEPKPSQGPPVWTQGAMEVATSTLSRKHLLRSCCPITRGAVSRKHLVLCSAIVIDHQTHTAHAHLPGQELT